MITAFNMSIALPQAFAAPQPASVTRARAAFTTPAAAAPWTGRAAIGASGAAAALLRQTPAQVTRLDASRLPQTLAPIRDAWTLVDRMRALASAAAGPLTATDRAAAALRFDELRDALRTRLAAAPMGAAQLFFGPPATRATSEGAATPPGTAVGKTAAAQRDAAISLPADAGVSVELRNVVRTARIDVSLAGLTSLDAVADRINAAIAAQPGSFAAQVEPRKLAEGWGLAVIGNGTSVRLGDNSARAVAGLLSGGAEPVLSAIDAAGRASAGPLQLKGFTPRQVAADDDGHVWAIGTDAQGSALARFDARGALVWRQALPGDAATLATAELRVAGDGALLRLGGETRLFDELGQRTARFATPNATATLATAPDAVLAATRDAAGEARLVRVGADGVRTEGAALGAGNVARLLTSGGANFAAANLNGEARVWRLDGLEVGATLSLGAGRIGALEADADGNLVALRVAPDGSRHLHRIDLAAGALSPTASVAVGFAATGIAVTADGVTAVGRDNGQIVAARFDPALSPAGRDAWNSMAPGEPLVFGWKAGGATLPALGLRAGAATSGDADALLARGRPLDPATGDTLVLGTARGDLRVTLEAGDTLRGLARRITRLLGAEGRASVEEQDGRLRLAIRALTPNGVALKPGPDGADLLAKLGLTEQRVAPPRLRGDKDPLVQPGGAFALKLDTLGGIGTRADAAAGLKLLDAAEGTLRSAWRSMFWDEAKAAIAAGPTRMTAADAARLNNWNEALRRLGGTP